MAAISAVSSSGATAPMTSKATDLAMPMAAKPVPEPAAAQDKASISDEGRAKLAQDEGRPVADAASATKAESSKSDGAAQSAATTVAASSKQDVTVGDRAKKMYEDVADSVKSAAHKAASWVTGGDKTPVKGT